MKSKNLVGPKGELKIGIHDAPVGEINYQDYPLRSAFRDLLPLAERQHQFIHFHFLGFTSNDYIVGCSLAHADNADTVFFYLFDRHSKETLSRGCFITADDKAEINLNPDDGTSILISKNMDVRFESNPNQLQKRLTVKLDGKQVLDFNFQEQTCEYQTLRLTTPTGPNGWTYAQKVAGIAAQGELNINGQVLNIEDMNAAAHHDFTAGYLRRDTFWNWACITGRNAADDLIGMNLSHGVNETSASENALWVNGKREAIAQTHFEYDLDDLSLPWHISSSDGKIDLHFTSEGKYTARHTKGDKPIDFSQLFGTFQGTVTTLSGEVLTINAIPGFCERQYSVWW